MAGKPRSATLVSKTTEEWAFLIWPYLLAAAKNRQTITYGELAETMNWGGAGVTGRVLGYIYAYCNVMKYPMLPVIVVNQTTGKPTADSLYTKKKTLKQKAVDIDSSREKVFWKNWYELPLPLPDDFVEAAKALF